MIKVFFLQFITFLNLLLLCQLSNAQNLKVRSVEFPDSVNIGETVMLKGYVVNSDNVAYSNQLDLNFDVEDTTPSNILGDGEVDQTINLNQVNIAPNDSVYFEQSINVSSSAFRVATVDLIIIWPQQPDNNTSNVAGRSNIRLAYVNDIGVATNLSDEFDFLPNDVLDYIYENFPGSTITDVEIDDCDFEIELDTGEELELPIYDCSDEQGIDQNNIDYDVNEDNYNDDDDDGARSDDDDDYGEMDDDDDDDNDNGVNNEEEDYGDDDDDSSFLNLSVIEIVKPNDKGEVALSNVTTFKSNNAIDSRKLTLDSPTYFTVRQTSHQITLTPKLGITCRSISLFNCSGKILFQQNINTAIDYSLPINKHNAVKGIVIIQMIGEDSNKQIIQQNQKLFIGIH